jgi:lysophospholipase L1-like esterase
MSMDRVHSLGDSWTCIEAGGENAGWQVYAGLAPAHRHGVPGSTARQWADDDGGILSDALAAMRRGDVVVVSLVGNDIRHAADDGQISFGEIVSSTRALYHVVGRLLDAHVRPVLLVYADPYVGHRPEASAGVLLMGTIIRGVAAMHHVDLFDCQQILVEPVHFDGKDFHPTAAGHRAIAAAVKQEVNG